MILSGVYYIDSNKVFRYQFDRASGRLLKVGGLIHNEILNLEYDSDGKLTSVVHSGNGQRLRMNYTSINRLVERIELLDAEGVVQEST